MAQLPRSSGVLLHPTSLPSAHGIGDLGASARDFVDRLAIANQRWWQLLPLNTPGHGGSPYSAESAFAGNPALIDLEALVQQDLLTRAEVDALAAHVATLATPDRVSFTQAVPAKLALLEKAAARFAALSGKPSDYHDFLERSASWLDDYALFAALKEEQGGVSWRQWPAALVKRQQRALGDAKKRLSAQIDAHCFYQYTFSQQWSALRAYARQHDVQIIGDIPIFVAMDSADVWANRHLFKMTADGQADVVAGVPPDYFSETGQKWGNPVYDWEAVTQEKFAWWIARVKESMALVELVRIDHFRGFQDYWETPEHEPTAMHGAWVPGPRDAFFDAIRDGLGEVPFIAEDLGDIDDAVYALRDRYGLPGMKVMHFAFGDDPDHPFLPHTYPEHCVAYTGTHDNDTTRGWYDAADEVMRHRVRTYLGAPDDSIVQAMVVALHKSRASLVVIPAQDIWGLDTRSRMNTPATVDGNWSWRMTRAQLDDTAAWRALGALTRDANRATT